MSVTKWLSAVQVGLAAATSLLAVGMWTLAAVDGSGALCLSAALVGLMAAVQWHLCD